ncbi:MAG: hypothetical protein MUF80_05875 [Burkholderiales bacterium]|jgi:hypothetical protein|nr:hypothetical protein [Burkholderiales bacterium]
MADVAAMSSRIDRLCKSIAKTCDESAFRSNSSDSVSLELLKDWQRELLLLVRELQSQRHRVGLELRALQSVPRDARFRASQSAVDRAGRVDSLIESAHLAIVKMLPVLVTEPKAPHPLIELLDKLDDMKDFNEALFGAGPRAECKKFFESMTVESSGHGSILKADPRSGFQPDLAVAMTTVLALVRFLILRRERQSNRR